MSYKHVNAQLRKRAQRIDKLVCELTQSGSFQKKPTDSTSKIMEFVLQSTYCITLTAIVSPKPQLPAGGVGNVVCLPGRSGFRTSPVHLRTGYAPFLSSSRSLPAKDHLVLGKYITGK